MEPTIKNADGTPVILNALEKKRCDYLQNISNALGYEIQITTLTTILKKISAQKFFTLPPADFMPVVVGEGAWSTNLTTYRSFELGDDFATGLINLGGNNARLASVDAAVDALNIKVNNWAKSIGWTIPELEVASRAGNWDLISGKEKSRKRNYDLGIQKLAFLGLKGDSNVLGLLNQAGITFGNELSGPISKLSVDDLKTFVSVILGDYRANCNHTAMPTHFSIPESDFLGLAAPASAQFPIKSTLAVLEETFKIMTNNPGFKILCNAYGDKAVSGLSKQMYVLLNYDEESLRMNIPVDYTSTLANSLDNFSFQNVAYAQFSGLQCLRPLELYYFGF